MTTYKKLCTEYYDREKLLTEEEFQFYLTYAQQANGKVLEPMCGTGRLLIPLLQAGIDIEGFDASAHMLDALRKKYAQLCNQAVPVWETFVQDFSSQKKYSLIFIPFGSWGLVTNNQTALASLKNLYEHLLPGGKLVIEVDTVNSLPTTLNTWQQYNHQRNDGSLLRLNSYCSYDQEKQLFSCKCVYESIAEGVILETEYELFTQYLYTFEECLAMLNNAGFSNIKTFKNFKKTVAEPSDPTIIYECII